MKLCAVYGAAWHEDIVLNIYDASETSSYMDTGRLAGYKVNKKCVLQTVVLKQLSVVLGGVVCFNLSNHQFNTSVLQYLQLFSASEFYSIEF